jgi:hypothetical protein
MKHNRGFRQHGCAIGEGRNCVVILVVYSLYLPL